MYTSSSVEGTVYRGGNNLGFGDSAMNCHLLMLLADHLRSLNKF